MTVFRRPLGLDAEVGKKHDDHQAPHSQMNLPLRSRWRLPRRRRLFLAVIAIYLLYIFFKNMPTDLGPAVERYDRRIAELRKQQSKSVITSPFENAPPRSKNNVDNEEELYYDEKVNFPVLGGSLYRANVDIKAQSGLDGDLRPGVLFAASHLRSVSDLIPMACEMARTDGNSVHFAIMGREPVSLEGIKRVNGVGEDDCPVYWHDARPDYAPWSTNRRMEVSVMAALDNIRAAVNIKVVITQRQALEDNFFSKAANDFSNGRRMTLINLPSGATDLMWLAKLDAEALSAWNKVHVEILIRIPDESSASLTRLLKSLREADYLDSKPSLTIELPPQPGPMLLRYLQILKGSNWAEKITIRGRINPRQLTPEESAVRTAESYIPFGSPSSSLLILSPQVELSPSFFHFLKYAILKYKHSAYDRSTAYQLVGISLERAFTTLTDGEIISFPSSMADDVLTLWQSPNSNAALYFGDKWEEFQNFLSRRLSPHDLAGSSLSQIVSKKYPAFVHYFLELMRARRYYMLYPLSHTTQDLSLVTVHNELYEPPEEFKVRRSDSTRKEINEHDVDELEKEGLWELGSEERPISQDSTLTKLLSRIPEGLPKLNSLQLLSYDGHVSNYDISYRESIEYGNTFRTQFGGCLVSETSDVLLHEPWVVEDLFCKVES